MDSILPMTSFAFATACTPGPNNIMLTASGVNFGFRRTIPHMLGIIVGFAIVLAAAGGGLGLLLAAYPAIHTALKVIGAAYMLWLAWKVATAAEPSGAHEAGAPLTFIEAAAFQWVNVKGVLTALGAVALFVHPQTAFPDMLAMMAVFVPVTIFSVALWTGFGVVVSGVLRDRRQARIFNTVMALLLVASIVPMVW
jgi:threonine/homoserine/homoserine lactone efflux protein